jgi:hypothetical protein
MSFGGGGAGALPAHEHTNAPLDGGPLDFNNTTIGSMAAGDITYSDGNALQILNAPGVPNNEVLTFQALATAPSWAPVAGLSGFGSVSVFLAANATSTSAAMTRVTNLTMTLPTIASGKALIAFSGTINRNQTGGGKIELQEDSSGGYLIIEGTGRSFENNHTNTKWALPSNCIQDTDGQDVAVFVECPGGTITLSGGAGGGVSSCSMSALGVG